MPGQTRIDDVCMCGKGNIGIFISGSQNVFVNTLNAVRATLDYYVCPHCVGVAVHGSPNVNINGRPAHRRYDETVDCDGMGYTLTGSIDVVDNTTIA